MHNLSSLLLLLGLLLAALIVGDPTSPSREKVSAERSPVPHIGRVQVLNGCGISGAAGAMADFLREHDFDVKDIDNAVTWNYPFTMIVSRTADMSVAMGIAEALKTDKCILLRTEDTTACNVTVIVGEDFQERIE